MYNRTSASGRFALLMWLFILICYPCRTQEQELNRLLTPNKVTVEECQDVTIWCRLTGPERHTENFSSRHRFSWSKRGDGGPDGITNIEDCHYNELGQLLILPEKYNYSLARDNMSCNLTVKTVQMSDAGCYQCDSWSPSGDVQPGYVELNVIEPKRKATLAQTSPQILENIPATFRCSAGYGIDHAEIVWLLDTVPLANRTELRFLMRHAVGGMDCAGRNETVSMLEMELQRDHTGLILTCQVWLLELLDSTQLMIPSIQVPPTSIMILDGVTGNPYNTSQEVLIEVRGNNTFVCLVKDTKPAAKVYWAFQGFELSGPPEGLVEGGISSKDGMADVTSTLVLLNVTWPDDDGGRLVCSATGAGGISQTTGVTIIVDAPPSNVALITSSAVVDNTSSVFECTALGTHTASSMVWYLDGFLLSDGETATYTSYLPELLETTSWINLSVQKEQHQGSRLKCEVHHSLLNEPVSEEITLDVLFCSSPFLICPNTMESGQMYNLTCRTGSSKPPAKLDIYSLTASSQVPYQQLSTTAQTNYAPGDHGGTTADLTVDITCDRNDHGNMVVCRKTPNQICQNEEFDECQLNVHFSPLKVTLSEGNRPAMTSVDSPAYRIVQVFDGRNYSFVCFAICSNPAALLQWSLESTEIKGALSTVTESGRPGECWNTTSRLLLTVRTDTHHAQRLTCNIINPLSGEVWKQRSLEFNIIVSGIDAASPATIITIIVCSSALALAIAMCIFGLLCKMTCRHRQQSSLGEDREMSHLHDSGNFQQPGVGLFWGWPKLPSQGGSFQVEQSLLTKVNSDKCFTSNDTTSISSSGSEAYEFPRKNLRLLEVIGSGSFGMVYKAMAEGIHAKGVASTVAVKTPNPSAKTADKDNFLKELELFTVLVQHPNVVSMLGYCKKKDPVYLIMEYVPNGNLEDYLWQEKQRIDQAYMNLHEATETVGSKQILTFANQIARGMKYLASVQCIHRDLATRNILLDENLVCKVSDFGLARHVPAHQQYEMKSEGRVPFRWMAPESLLRSIYTTKSDVWSFGVLLWELVTLGSHPYPGMSCSEVLEALLQGFCLSKPAHCSDEIYELMKDCWQIIPEDRPDFEMLCKMIEAMLANASGYLLMSNFSSDQYVYMAPGKKGAEG